MLFTDSPPVPPSKRRQTRVSHEQNGFPVCCRNKQRNFINNHASCSKNTRKGDEVRFGSFLKLPNLTVQTGNSLSF